MTSNQDIFAKHAYNQFHKMDSTTSLVMLPLRLETKIRDNVTITRNHDEHNVLFVLQALWSVLQSLDRGDRTLYDTAVLTLRAEVYKLQAMLREDEARVMTALDLVLQAAERKGYATDTIREARDDARRIAVVDTSTDNRATLLLREVRRQRKRYYSNAFHGNQRGLGSCYSATRRYKEVGSHMHELAEFFSHFAERLAEVPAIDNQQKSALINELNALMHPGYCFTRRQAHRFLSVLKACGAEKQGLTDNELADFCAIFTEIIDRGHVFDPDKKRRITDIAMKMHPLGVAIGCHNEAFHSVLFLEQTLQYAAKRKAELTVRLKKLQANHRQRRTTDLNDFGTATDSRQQRSKAKKREMTALEASISATKAERQAISDAINAVSGFFCHKGDNRRFAGIFADACDRGFVLSASDMDFMNRVLTLESQLYDNTALSQVYDLARGMGYNPGTFLAAVAERFFNDYAAKKLPHADTHKDEVEAFRAAVCKNTVCRRPVFDDLSPKNISSAEYSKLVAAAMKDDKAGDISGELKSLRRARLYAEKCWGEAHRALYKANLPKVVAQLQSQRVRDAKTATLHRYTELAFMLMAWKARGVERGRYDFAADHHDALCHIAGQTLFNYSHELQWMHSVVADYNTHAIEVGKKYIEQWLLNKHSRYIRRHKMTYTYSGKALCVRIYPDELAVTSLRKSISRQEMADVKQFLGEYFFDQPKGVYALKGDARQAFASVSNYRLTAWDNLCRKYQPWRAAWIVRYFLTTANPVITPDGETVAVPVTGILPTRFALQAVVKTGSDKTFTLKHYGRRLPLTLQVGLDLSDQRTDPTASIVQDDDDRLRMQGELRWMTDYYEAERMGMAITLPLSGVNARVKHHKDGSTTVHPYEFPAIYVTGIRDNLDTAAGEGSALLNDVMEAHLFSEEGMDMLATGTPTNLLDDDTPMAFDTNPQSVKDRMFRLVERSLAMVGTGYAWRPAAAGSQADSQRLATALGVDTLSLNALNETAACSKAEAQLVKQANTLLLDTLAADGNPLLRLISTNTTLRDFFTNYVSARGPYSALRIGSQPYAVLPVGDLRNITLNDPTLRRLHAVLLKLTDYWNAIAEQNHVVDQQNQSDDFLHLMGKTPVSEVVESQETVKIGNFLVADYFKSDANRNLLTADMARILGCTKQVVEAFIPNYDYIPLTEEQFLRPYANDEIATTTAQGRQSVASLVEKLTSRLGSLLPEDPQQRRDSVLRLVMEFVDLFSHRLDAWVMALLCYSHKLATATPRDLNGKKPCRRIAIGSYGWVFDLKEPSEQDKRLLDDYNLAPTINHAVTSAVLRGAYNNRSQAGEGSEVVDIDMSSARVRKALRIIQGVRGGLAVGAILGADCERLLHDAWKPAPEGRGTEMDEYVWPLRQKFPQQEPKDRGDNGGQQWAKTTPNVVNGAMLLQNLRDYGAQHATDPKAFADDNRNIGDYFAAHFDQFSGWCSDCGLPDTFPEGKPEMRTAKERVLLEVVQEVYDSYDALMDVVLSGSIYELCLGNTDAASALMAALNEESMLPVPRVVDVPLDHARIENKMMLMLDTDTAMPTDNASVFAAADINLCKWMHRILGMAADSSVDAAELVYLLSDSEAFAEYAKHTGFDYAQYEYAANALRDMLSTARPADYNDLMQQSPAEEIIQWYDGYDMRQRYQTVRAAVEDCEAEVKRLLDDAATLTRDAVKDTLWRCYRTGCTQVVQAMRTGRLIASEEMTEEEVAAVPDQDIDFVKVLDTVAAELRSRLDKAEELQMAADAEELAANTDDMTQLSMEKYRSAIQALTMACVSIVPVVKTEYKMVTDTVTNADGVAEETQTPLIPVAEITAQLSGLCTFSNAGDAACDDWMSQMADIRPAVQSVYSQLIYTTMAGGDVPRVTPLQLPLKRDTNGMVEKRQEWLGAEVSGEDRVMDANVYMVLQAEHLPQPPASAAGKMAMCGLVVDFWTEKIPLKEQTAALSFKFDQPDAEPPQAILMVMPKSDSPNWRWSEKHLLGSMKSTLHMVKCRAVEPDHMATAGWSRGLLPLVDIALPEHTDTSK